MYIYCNVFCIFNECILVKNWTTSLPAHKKYLMWYCKTFWG